MCKYYFQCHQRQALAPSRPGIDKLRLRGHLEALKLLNQAAELEENALKLCYKIALFWTHLGIEPATYQSLCRC